MAVPAHSSKNTSLIAMLPHREAALARAVSDMRKAAAEVQKASAELSICEAAWLTAYEAALRMAENDAEACAVRRAATELKSQPGVCYNTLRTFHDEGECLTPSPAEPGSLPSESHGQEHGHSHDDEFHTAKHQLEHRWIEKTAFSAAERVVERMTERITESMGERVGERLAERGVERLAERGAERLAERGVERLAERGAERLAERGAERLAERGAELALERAGAGALRHILGRTIGETLRMGEHAAMHTLKALRVIVPFVGMLFVIHLAEHDWHRLLEEWRARRALSLAFFWMAVLGDVADILCHVCVISSGILHVDHHALHTIEPLAFKNFHGLARAANM